MISFGGSVLGVVPHRHGCVGSLAAWQHDYNGEPPPPQPRATALLQPRAAAAAALCHRRCSFMPPPLQPRATTAANTAAALCHRCCSLVPPPLVQPGPSLAPCCRSCLQHHHSFNLISPLTSQPQHVSTRATSPRQPLASCQDSLLPAAASCAAAAAVWYMVDTILARPPLCRTEAAERRSSGLDSMLTASSRGARFFDRQAARVQGVVLSGLILPPRRARQATSSTT